MFVTGFTLQIANAIQDSQQHMESISGKSLRIIQMALPEAARKNLDLVKFKVEVLELEFSYLVIFDDPNRPAGQRGSTSKVQCFEVEIRKSDLFVLRANFAR
jgi:hypothetical protein